MNCGDNIGHNKIRRFIYEEGKWTDKSVKRHKHDFSQQGIIHLYGVDESKRMGHWYYIANICDKCNSFINAKFIPRKDYDILYNLPHRRFIKSHFALGFKDIQYVDDVVEVILA